MNKLLQDIQESRPGKFLVDHKKALIIILKLIFTAWLLYYLSRRIDAAGTIQIFKNGSLPLIFAAFLLLPVNLFFQFIKWKLISGKCLSQTSGRRVLSSLLQGIAAGIFTPFRAGEYVGRKFALGRVPLLDVTIATVIDKLFSIFAVYSVGVFAALAYASLSFGLSGVWLGVYSALFALFAVLLLFKKNLRGSVKNLSEYLPMNKFTKRLRLLGRLDRPSAVKAQLYTYAAFFTYLVQFALLLKAFAPACPVYTAFWISCLTYFAKTVVPAVTIVDIGVRELSAMFFAARFGYNEQAGFNAALIVFIINLIIPAIAGTILLFTDARNAKAK